MMTAAASSKPVRYEAMTQLPKVPAVVDALAAMEFSLIVPQIVRPDAASRKRL
jgi:hypothetical protein